MTRTAASAAPHRKAYSQSFFEAVEPMSLSSAARVVPMVTELVQPASVVDVGCGSGAWLSVFAEQGVDDIFGIDGYEPERLLFREDHFLLCDLNLDFRLPRSFELAICLEVAEHLRPDSAPRLVAGLTRLAPVVLFSAGAPTQGGTEHINERWPDYWASLFAGHDFEVLDPIRRRIWTDPGVSWWYAPNTLLYVHCDELNRRPVWSARRRRPFRSS